MGRLGRAFGGLEGPTSVEGEPTEAIVEGDVVALAGTEDGAVGWAEGPRLDAVAMDAAKDTDGVFCVEEDASGELLGPDLSLGGEPFIAS